MASNSDGESYKGSKHDLINRGVKQRDVPGTLTFVGLRVLDPLLQYGILANGVGSSLVRKLGIDTLPPGLATNTGISLIDSLGLSPYRLILLGMSVGTVVKQTYWNVAVRQEEFPPSAAVIIAGYNTLINSINSLLFTTTFGSASLDSGANFPQYPLLVGGACYVVGILTEAIAEEQRKHFKKDPANKGQPCTTGLWSVARHINYGGYALWRFGYALAAGGWIWASIMAGFQTWDFTQRAIPVLDEYCTNRVSLPYRSSSCWIHWTYSNAMFAVWRYVERFQAEDAVQNLSLRLVIPEKQRNHEIRHGSRFFEDNPCDVTNAGFVSDNSFSPSSELASLSTKDTCNEGTLNIGLI